MTSRPRPNLSRPGMFLVAALAVSPISGQDEKIDFGRQIRPLLAEKCFACHGLDGETRSTDFRMDTKDGMFAALESGGVAVAPGKLDERGVQCIQLFHRGWDQHANLPADLRNQCRDIDQPTRALIQDLKQRDMLKDTLIVWGGEFGRTVYCQGTLTRDNYGRDHHPRCFTMWMAGGGIQGGRSLGATDDFSYNIIADPARISDINHTILHCLGIDNRKMSVKFQGLDARITGVEDSRLLHEVLA